MLRDKINASVKEAMLSKQQSRVNALRMITATLKDKDISARGNGKDPISDEDILGMLQSMIKQRRESIDVYKKGNRADLAEKEQFEIDTISKFLPQQLSEAEVKAAIEAVVKETGATSIKDMGKVMAALRAKYAGQMDFGAASNLIKATLN